MASSVKALKLVHGTAQAVLTHRLTLGQGSSGPPTDMEIAEGNFGVKHGDVVKVARGRVGGNVPPTLQAVPESS